IWGINKMLAAQADRAAWHIDQDARQRERERQLREWRPEPPTLESRWRPLTAEDYNATSTLPTRTARMTATRFCMHRIPTSHPIGGSKGKLNCPGIPDRLLRAGGFDRTSNGMPRILYSHLNGGAIFIRCASSR